MLQRRGERKREVMVDEGEKEEEGSEGRRERREGTAVSTMEVRGER